MKTNKHNQSELDNPSYAARKSENPLNHETHRLGCQSSSFDRNRKMNQTFTTGCATIEPIIEGWKTAAKSGTFLTEKHNPNMTHVTKPRDRSILTPHVSSSLIGFLDSGSCKIDHYYDSAYPNGPGYFAVTPTSGSLPDIVGSGVPAHSTEPSGSKDTLIVVSGSVQGWHLHAEESSVIENKINEGRLQFLATYHK